MKILLLLLALLLPMMARADEGMIKIVYRTLAPELAPDAFEAQPKTLYRWGDKSRLECPYDPGLKVKILGIYNGKDLWFINQLDNTAGHMAGPGPHFFFPLILPIAKDGQPQRATDFAFGREVAYMKAHQVKPTSVTANGTTTTIYETNQEGLKLQVYLVPGTQTPMGISVDEGDHCLQRLLYDEYTTGLKPDPTLFQVPSGVKISEVPQH